MLPHGLVILFLFMLGASIGSFLNVVVWRLPRGKSLLYPPSACPKCGHGLAAYDNIPVFGWILLGGKCRYCHEPISARYPIVEGLTGLLFVFYYVAIFIWHLGPYGLTQDSFGVSEYTSMMSIEQDWAIFGLILFMVCSLLAASLIDAELYIIPIEIPWVLAGVAILTHGLVARPHDVGVLSAGPVTAAFAVGAMAGLVLSNALMWMKLLPRSFPAGEPMLDFERQELEEKMKEEGADEKALAELPPVATKSEIRKQILLEVAFLALPAALAGLGAWLAAGEGELATWWREMLRDHTWVAGVCGSVFGGLVAGALIWVTRILASLALGRVAMGQGDTHLMFGIGAVIGAWGSVLVFFMAPFCGLLVGVYKWLSKGARELPYGPYLSLAACVVILVSRYADGYLKMFR